MRGALQACKSDEEMRRRGKEELGDILIYALTMAHEFTFNPTDIILQKIQINDEKYPAEMVKGKSDKYTDYDKKRRRT